MLEVPESQQNILANKILESRSRRTQMPSATRKNYKTCMDEYCGKDFIKRQSKMMKYIGKHLKIKVPKTLKLRKEDYANCSRAYCNPGCKGTLFESGKYLSKAAKHRITKKFKGKNSKLLLDIIKSTRKNIFKGKTSVLKDDFYKKIPSKQVAIAKRKGALSGCTMGIL